MSEPLKPDYSICLDNFYRIGGRTYLVSCLVDVHIVDGQVTFSSIMVDQSSIMNRVRVFSEDLTREQYLRKNALESGLLF